MKKYVFVVSLSLLVTCLGCNSPLTLTTGSANQPGDANKTSTVYIDPSASVPGDGTLKAPYQYWSEVRFQPGYSYLQRRGTIARESIILSTSGTASRPIVIGAYGTGAAPVIQGSERESGWTLAHGSIYEKSIILSPGQGLGMASEDGIPLTWLEWDTDLDTTFTGASPGSYAYDPASNTSYIWCTDSGNPDTKDIEVSRRYFGIRGVDVSHIRISNLHVRYASLHGISFEDAEHVSVSECTIEKLGGAVIAPGPIYGGNGIEFGDSSAYGTVRNCVISEIFDSGVTPQTYSANQTASQFLFADLTISRCGFAGVEVAALYNGGMTNSSIADVTVRRVTVTDSGKGWSGRRYGIEGRGIKIKADISGADNTRHLSGIVVEDCTVSGSAGEGVFVGGNAGTVTVRRCTISNNDGTGVLAQEAETSTLLLDIYSSIIHSNGAVANEHGLAYNLPSGNGLRVRQCTFYNNHFLGLNIWAHSGEALIKNNIFHASTGRTHLLINPDISATAAIANNCFTEFAPGTDIFYFNGTTYDTVSAFDAALAFAQDDIGTANPGLTASLAIQNTSSPCYRAGTASAAVTTDRNGIPFGIPPSIGGFEYQ